MPAQKKFFVLYSNVSGWPASILHCIVTADSPEKVAQLLQGTFKDHTEGGHRVIGESEKRRQGRIVFSKDLFQPVTEPGMEDYLEYKRGCFHFLIYKEDKRFELSVALEELPIMGRCSMRDCDEIATCVSSVVLRCRRG